MLPARNGNYNCVIITHRVYNYLCLEVYNQSIDKNFAIYTSLYILLIRGGACIRECLGTGMWAGVRLRLFIIIIIEKLKIGRQEMTYTLSTSRKKSS